jgi:hypothetical protein
MSIAGLGMLGVLPALLLVVCQWVGVIGLAGRGRDGPWRLMCGGTAATTLGMVGTLGVLVLSFTDMARGTGGAEPLGVFALLFAAGAGFLGTLLFGTGFAWHGLKARRSQERASELEQLVAAMDEELRRLRPPPAG